VVFALSGVRLWDGASDALRPGLATLRIEDGRIAGIGDSAELEGDAERIDLRGAVASRAVRPRTCT
jgi:cytosine/adenosine deaminase-related metal-dependent hydrolase